MANKLIDLQAIRKVLRKSDRPLSSNEIYNAWKDQNLIRFDQAKTPLKTISSRIGQEIDHNGTDSLFIRTRFPQLELQGLKGKLPPSEIPSKRPRSSSA